MLNCNEDMIDRDYLFYTLRSGLIAHQFERYSSGAGYPEINREKDLPRVKIPCPSDLDTQRDLVAKIGPVIDQARDVFREAEQRRKDAMEVFEGSFPDA